MIREWSYFVGSRFGCEPLFSDSKKRFQGAGAQSLPNLDHFISDNGSKGHGQPDADSLDRQPGPCSDLQADETIAAIFPPAIRQSERHFPKQADKKKQKKREAEGAPGNEPLCGIKKAGGGNERSADEISKIPREPFRCVGDELSVHNCRRDQDNTEDHGSKMKTNDARYIPRSEEHTSELQSHSDI